MIGLPTPNGSAAPRAYGNPQNLSTPGVANNRMGGNVQPTNKPPMMMGGPPQQQAQQPQPMMMGAPQQQGQPMPIGIAPGGAMPPEQQPMYNQRQVDPVALMMMMQSTGAGQQQQSQPFNGGGPGLSFGKQYNEQDIPAG